MRIQEAKNMRILQNRMPIRIRNSAYFINKFFDVFISLLSLVRTRIQNSGFRIRGSWSVSRTTVLMQFFLVCRNQCGEAYATTTLTVKRRKDDYRSVLKHNVKREYIRLSRGSLATSEQIYSTLYTEILLKTCFPQIQFSGSNTARVFFFFSLS